MFVISPLNARAQVLIYCSKLLQNSHNIESVFIDDCIDFLILHTCKLRKQLEELEEEEMMKKFGIFS